MCLEVENCVSFRPKKKKKKKKGLFQKKKFKKKKKQEVCHTVTLPFALKSGKRRIMKTQIIHHVKI